jgi:hypothetical protein
MPKYTRNETEFRISIAKSGEQYRATVPKLLMERLSDAVAISGHFMIRNGEIVLTEKTRTITITKLLSQWWPLPAGVTRDQVSDMDWDQLLEVLGLEVDDYEGKHITVGDFDAKSYDTLHVVFNAE